MTALVFHLVTAIRNGWSRLYPAQTENVWLGFRQFVRNDSMALLDKTQVAWSQFPKPTVAIKSRRPHNFSVLLTFSSTSFAQEFIFDIINNFLFSWHFHQRTLPKNLYSTSSPTPKMWTINLCWDLRISETNAVYLPLMMIYYTPAVSIQPRY